MPVQGGEPQKISGHLSTRPGVEVIYSIAWHPNGRNVSCVVTSGDNSGPWTIDIQSGVAHKIPFGYDGFTERMDWSPDGKKIVFCKEMKPINKFWLLDNFLPEKKKD